MHAIPLCLARFSESEGMLACVYTRMRSRECSEHCVQPQNNIPENETTNRACTRCSKFPEFSLHLTLQEFVIVLTYDTHSEAEMQIDAIMLQEQFKLQKAPKVQ